MNLIAERVKVTDTSGNSVDIRAALNAPLLPTEAAADDAEAADDQEVLAATQTDAPAEAEPAEADPSESEETAEA